MSNSNEEEMEPQAQGRGDKQGWTNIAIVTMLGFLGVMSTSITKHFPSVFYIEFLNERKLDKTIGNTKNELSSLY